MLAFLADGTPARLDVEIVHAVVQKHGRALAVLARTQREAAKEYLMTAARHVVAIVARHYRVASWAQDK